jgi:hypothetical protein
MRVRTRIVSAVAVAVMMSWGGTAWTQTTDRAGIEGKVIDQGGGVLPGVTVTIASPALLGGARSTTTDGAGAYRFAALPAGTYQVTFELSGFAPVKREVRLATGFVATVNETLRVGGIEESVTVRAESPVVDVRTTSVSTNLGKEALEQLPTSRSMWQVMNLAPGLRVSGVDVGGTAVGTQQGYSNYGTSTGGNKPLLDGVDTREDAGGAGFYYDYGAFEEVQIKAMGNDAEMSTPGTQFMGILKSGGDKFRGTGYWGWETPKLQSNNITDALRARGVTEGNPLVAYHDGNADLGGPVFKRRLWFYGSYRHQQIKQRVLGYVASPGPDNVPGTADDAPGNYLVTLTNATAKLTGQLGPTHRFSGFVQAQTKDYPERGADSYRYLESTWHQVFKPMAGKAEWSWVISDRTYLNAFVGRWKYDTDGLNWTEDPPAYDTVTLRYWGRWNTTPYRGGRDRWQYNASLSRFVPNAWGGSHDIKVGAEFTDEGRYYNAPPKSGGRDYQLRFQNGAPYQVIAYNYPYFTTNNMTTQSVYLRDAWLFGDRATLNLGVRYEAYHVFVPAQSKPAGRFYPGGDFPRTEVLTWRNWAPRIGLSLPLDSSNRTVVKATYGWFNFATQVLYADDYNRNASASTTYRWTDLNGNRDYDDGEFGTFVTATGATTAATNPDLTQPKTHELTTSIERQVASNFSARASYVYRREVDRYRNVNVLRPYEAYSVAIPNVDPGPDGVVGTADDGGALTYYEYAADYAGAAFIKNMDLNAPGHENFYHSVEVAAQKRLSNRWQLVTSVLATHRNAWRSGPPVTPNEAGFYPKTKHWEWSYKLAGSYDFPYAIQAAATFTSQSGDVWAREARFTTGLVRSGSLVLLMEDPASNRLPTQNLLNVRVEKRQKIGPGFASFQFDLFNITNTNVELGVTARSGSSFGRITSIVPPRVVRLGVSYKF